jgi:DNA-binding response OmpR family regulator
MWTSQPEQDGIALLVVEDCETTLQAIQHYCEASGFAVYKAKRPSEALAIARTRHLDIAVIDHGLPEMSGTALATMLRGIQPGMRVVMTSGYPRDVVRFDGPFLENPYRLRELTQLVRELAQR